MVLIFCNQCFDSKAETHQKFVITNCYHIFCEGCAKNAMAKNFCIVCKKPCKILPINDQLPTEVKNYFDPKSIERLVDTVEKISRFIDTQNKAFVTKNAQHRTTYLKYKKSVLDMKEHSKKIDHAIAREKTIIERLRNAYKTNFITTELFNLRSPPIDGFGDDDSFGNDRASKENSPTEGYFEEVKGKTQPDKLHPTQHNRY